MFENPAYGRYWLVWRVWIVAKIIWSSVFLTHFWALHSHLFAFLWLFVTFLALFVEKLIMCPNSHVKCHISWVTCHLPPVTIGKPYKENASLIWVFFKPVIQFWYPSIFRILSTICRHQYQHHMYPLYFMKKEKKTWYFGRYWQSELLWHTHRQMDEASFWPTRPRGLSRWKT